MIIKAKQFVSILMAAILAALSIAAADAHADDNRYLRYSDKIIGYMLEKTESDTVQEFIDGYLADNAGNGECEWYVYCLSQEKKYDFSGYTAALEQKINSAGYKATDLQRMTIAYYAAGGKNLDVGAIVDESWNKLGIMSEIYGLILLNLGDFESKTESSEIARSIASRQLDDGGWALSGKYSDTDVTAMALQALSVYRTSDSYKEIIEKGLNRLSSLQQPDGGYRSYGTANAESCTQVIITLCQLGIDFETDKNFIKNGNTVFDSLEGYKCASGGYSHIPEGKENKIATYQAFAAMTAVKNYRKTGRGLYLLSQQNDEPMENQIQPTQNTDDKKPPVTTSVSENTSESVTTVLTATDNAKTESSSAVSTSGIVTETTASDGTALISTLVANDDKEMPSYTSAKSENETTTTTTALILLSDSEASDSCFPGWKTAALAVIGGVFAASQLYCIAVRRFSLKRLGVSAAICIIGAGAVLFIRIQTPEEYYSRNIDDVRPDSLTVTLSVSCDTLSGDLENGCVIIPETEYVLLENDTVFTVLERVLAYNRIPLDYTGVSSSDVYIRGINNIYEAEYGEMSGWMYIVNGEFPDKGCGSYVPADGDRIEWLYTRNTGADIGAEEYR